MAINLETEMVVRLTEATKILPPRNGKRIAICTLWRWCRKGLRGVRLEYVRIGRNIATSRQALNRFFTALAEADPPIESPPQTPRPINLRPTSKARQRMLEEADQILERAGI